MPYPDNLLVRGEQVIVRKRPHWKVLILPTIFFILIIGGGFALAALWRNWEYASIANWVLVGIGVLALIVLVIGPVVRWRTEHFVITNHHVFFRTGLLARREHQIPLGQIANMETEVTFWGRLLGFGSLIVESSADQPLKFRNVASLGKVQSTLNQLIRDERERTHRHDGGGYDGEIDDETRPATAPQPTQAYPPQSYSPSYPPPSYPPPQQAYSPPPGYPQQGPPHGGYPQQGYQQQGHPQQGQPQQGYAAPPPAYPPQGQGQPGWTPPPGDSAQGNSQQGTAPQPWAPSQPPGPPPQAPPPEPPAASPAGSSPYSPSPSSPGPAADQDRPPTRS